MLFVAFEGSLDHIGKQPGFASHHFGELFGAFDRLPEMRGELFDEEFESRVIVRKGKDFALIDGADTDRRGEFPISEIDEFEVIGKDQIVQRAFVSVELLLVPVLFQAMQIRVSDVFGLNVADGDFLFVCQNVIRGTASLALGFVGGADAGSEGFEEILEIAPKGVFGRIAKAKAGIEGKKVFGCGHERNRWYLGWK